jgi:acyl-CoA thioester hydrolase
MVRESNEDKNRKVKAVTQVMDDAISEPCETAIFVLKRDVHEDEIDVLGHVNNLVYIKWILSAATAHSDACGWTTERYLKAQAGWVVRSHKIEYFVAARPGDHITIRTWVSGFKKVTSLRRYQIIRTSDDTILAEAETNWAFIGFEHHVPRRIPKEVIDDFRSYRPAAELSCESTNND